MFKLLEGGEARAFVWLLTLGLAPHDTDAPEKSQKNHQVVQIPGHTLG